MSPARLMRARSRKAPKKRVYPLPLRRHSARRPQPKHCLRFHPPEQMFPPVLLRFLPLLRC